MLIILRLGIYILCCWSDTNHTKFSIIKLIIISKLKEREREMTLLLMLVILKLHIIYYVIEATPIILSFFY